MLFSVLDAIADGVSVVDRERTIVYMNKALIRRFGDLVGKKCYETALGGPEWCKVCPLQVDWDYTKGPFVRRGEPLGGRYYDVFVDKFVDPETGEPYWVSFERDITDEIEKTNRLKLLASSFDHMVEAVCVADTEGRIVYVNPAYKTLTGYDEKTVAGLSITDSSLPGASGGTMHTILKIASSRPWRGEMTGLRRDGTRYYTQVDARPVSDDRGRPMGVVAILRDITRQKTERVEFEKYASELEAKMEARTLELARRVSQLTTINKISRVITSILDPDELVSEFVKAIAQGFGYRHVSMMALDKERGDLYFKAGYGWDEDTVPRDLRLKLKEGIIGHAAYFGETLVCGDVEADPRYVRKSNMSTKSELAVPVTFRGELLGVLDIQSEVKEAFTRNDVNTMEMLADMLATSIVNARMYSESKEREAALSVLDRISKQISYRLEPSVILDQVARDAAALLKAEKSEVGLLDPSGKSITIVATYRIEKEKLAGHESYDASTGVTGRSLKSMKTEVVNDYLSDPDAIESDAERFGIRSMVSAPLIIEGRGIGVVNVYNKMGGKPFTKSDALFLSSLADHAAIALENANLLSSLNQRVRSQLALLETAASIQRQIDASSIYEVVSDKLREVVWYDAITFYKVDHDRRMITPLVARGPYTEEIMAEEFSMDTGITGHVARTGRAELVNDTLSDPRAVLVAGTPADKEAMMAIPMIIKGKVVGVLALYRDEAVFTDTEFEIAQLFANQAAVAVENAELYAAREHLLRESRRKVEQMAKVLELTTSVMYMDDLNRLLQRVADAVVQSFGFRRATVTLYDPDRDVFEVRARSGFPSWAQEVKTKDARMMNALFDERFRVGATSYLVKFEDQPFGIEAFDYLAHPELADKPRQGPKSWHERDLLFSVFKDRAGHISGYLQVDEPNDMMLPGADQVEVLEILSGIASIAVENARLYERQVMAANEIALLNDLMTHDINNFNQGIMGYLELLLQDKRLDDNQRRYAERALLQVRNNARLIDNVRKLAKVRMMSDEDFEPKDLHAAVSEAVELVTKSMSDRKVTIASNLEPNKHFVMANEHLGDIFLNVLSNAVKFDSSKRVRVDVQIDEETTPQGAFWVISVIDRGRGIPDDRKKAVFERFATGITGVKGFGLGLSIVSAIVNKYGGRIWVEDRVKGDFTKGAVFKIALPKAKPPEKSVAQDRAAQPEGDVSASSTSQTPGQP